MAEIKVNSTLNRIFDVVKAMAENHKMIADCSIGDAASRGTSKGKEDEDKKPRELEFPYLFVDANGVGVEVGQGGNVAAKIYRINLFVADKHSDNAENDDEILSDTESILSDLIIYITQNQTLRKFIIGLGVTELIPARHTTIQEAYGWQCVINIKVQASICWEQLPFKDSNC